MQKVVECSGVMIHFYVIQQAWQELFFFRHFLWPFLLSLSLPYQGPFFLGLLLVDDQLYHDPSPDWPDHQVSWTRKPEQWNPDNELIEHPRTLDQIRVTV